MEMINMNGSQIGSGEASMYKKTESIQNKGCKVNQYLEIKENQWSCQQAFKFLPQSKLSYLSAESFSFNSSEVISSSRKSFEVNASIWPKIKYQT